MNLLSRCPLTKTLLGAAAALTLSLPTSRAEAAAPSVALPDWSGLWQMVGGSIWEPDKVTPPGGGSGQPGVREHPPYNAVWEKKYDENIDKITRDLFPDPISFCGVPAGYPRLLNLPDSYEFALRPEQVWILSENGPNILRIYTDGRPHLGADEIGPSYTGDSIGHWEGDTLVIDTVGLKGAGDVILNRTGLINSEMLHVTARARKTADGMIEFQLVLEDPVAFTAPWKVVKRFKKLATNLRALDYACGENNRNPVDAAGRTLTLGPDGKPLDDPLPAPPAR